MTDSNEQEVVVQQPTVEGVVRELRVASLDELKAIREVRKANAQPFTIPGTDITVMIAPCTATDSYKAQIAQLKAIKIESDEERVGFLQATASALIKSCVVDPVLDDEALAALNDFDATAIGALFDKCQQMSQLGDVGETGLMESFS